MDILLWSLMAFLIGYGWWIYKRLQLESGNWHLTEEEEAHRWGKILQSLPDERRAKIKREISSELSQSKVISSES